MLFGGPAYAYIWCRCHADHTLALAYGRVGLGSGGSVFIATLMEDVGTNGTGSNFTLTNVDETRLQVGLFHYVNTRSGLVPYPVKVRQGIRAAS